MLDVIRSLSARLLCCRAFFALFGANRASRSSKANLNLSAIGNSKVLEGAWILSLEATLHTAHVFGSISSKTESSNIVLGNASRGICIPRRLRREGVGLIEMRGHSATTCLELSSIFGWKNNQISAPELLHSEH